MSIVQLFTYLLATISVLAAQSIAATTQGLRPRARSLQRREASDYSWECGENSEVNVNDCDEVIDDIRTLGDENGGWWTVRQYFCREWEHKTCKATFCPLAYPDNGLKVWTEDVAGSLFWSLEVLCGMHGRRGMIKPDNSSWELYLSDSSWSHDDGD